MIRLIIGLFILAFSCTGCFAQSDDKSLAEDNILNELSAAGTSSAENPRFKNAPDFKLQDINQAMVSLSDYTGKQPVLLFFWTTWCPYCQKELKSLNTMYQDLVADGLEVLAIDVGELPSRVISHVSSFRLSYRVLLDKDTRVSSLFGVMGVPTYTLIDKEGAVVFQDNYFPLKEYKALVK